MNKILLTIAIALVFLFSAAGVTIAAAQQSQPGQALYPLQTWSRQIVHQQEKIQVRVGQMGNMVHTQSDMHEQVTFPTLQSTATLDPCNQPGTAALCGSDHEAGVHHQNDHPNREHNRTEHLNDGAHHANDRTEHHSHESDHGHDRDH